MESISGGKNRGYKKIKLIVLATTILIILGGTTFAYFKLPTFNQKVKNLISKIPWSTYSKGESLLTEKETNDKMEDLAEYYISLDVKEAADKLYLIKKDDEMLYSNMVKLMNKKSSPKTSEIIKLVRNLENRGDLLVALHDEISREKQKQINLKINRLEEQDLIMTVKEIKNILSADTNSKEEVAEIFNNLDESILSNAMYYLEEEYREQVLDLLEEDKRSSIESQVSTISNKKLHLKDLANFYETKTLEAALKEIGNTEQYTIEELGVIYSNLSIIKAAEILSNVDDEDFIKDVLASVRREQNLNNIEPTTEKITEAIDFIEEYNRKINDLVKVYERMSPDKIALITEKMINNDSTVTVLQWDSEPVFEVTDAMIITDVLSKLKDKTLSRVINLMSTDNAYKLTQMLAKP